MTEQNQNALLDILLIPDAVLKVVTTSREINDLQKAQVQQQIELICENINGLVGLSKKSKDTFINMMSNLNPMKPVEYIEEQTQFEGFEVRMFGDKGFWEYITPDGAVSDKNYVTRELCVAAAIESLNNKS